MQYNAAMRAGREGRMKRLPRNVHSLVLIVCILVLIPSACTTGEETSSIGASITTTPASEEAEWVRVYFTDPEAEYAGSYRGGVDALIVEAIDNARLSVDLAIYNLNLWSVRNALIEAHARGVVVRIVTDSDNLGGEEFQDLAEAGIPVLGDRRESLMHNKFLIIDRYEVWTGSMNFTLNGAYEDNNNIVQITSNEIAENYLTEFNEMFEEDLFGDESPSDTPYPVVTVGRTTVETYFSPEDGVKERLIELIEGASESIHFLAYSFTSDELGKAIRSRVEAGVIVAGVMDGEQAISNEGTEFDGFMQAALDVRLDGIDGLMHHKIIIIDGTIVITGSYNFSRNADESNDENVLIIHDPRIASVYSSEFWRLYNIATSP